MPLRAIEIANLTALNMKNEIPEKLDNLIANIKKQPDDYTIGWTFNGTVHFIKASETLASDRDWLLSFFDAIQRDNRDDIVEGLRVVKRQNKK